MFMPIDSVRKNANAAVRYRGLKSTALKQFEIAYGCCQCMKVSKGDLITLINVDGGQCVLLAALDINSNNSSPELVGLKVKHTATLDDTQFDGRQLQALLSERGLCLRDLNAVSIFENDTPADDRFTLEIKADCHFFVISPLKLNGLETGAGGAMRLEVHAASNPSDTIFLPDPLGKVVDEFRIPRASAKAYQVKKGQYIQVIDVEGQQCSDFMAMRSSALDQGIERFIDGTVTRTMTHSAYPKPGMLDKFFDQDMRPLLSVAQDTVGRHDTFALACTARGYEERGFPGHINCSDNISAAYAPFSIHKRAAWPAVNFFFNSHISPHDNDLSSGEAWSRAGDYVAMQAMTDLVCVSTACPDDVDPINGWNPTDIHVRIYEEDTNLQKSMYYRAQPEDAGTMTNFSAFHPRTSALTSQFHVARDVWLPAHFDATGAVSEYWATKEAVTLQDMSSLRKFDVMGPDAEQLLQHCMTRNVAKLAEHRGFYALLCDMRGAVIDDGTLFRMSHDVFRWCCGSDDSALHLREHAQHLGLRVWVKSLSETMPNLALQGPKSRALLSKLVFTQPTRPALENIKWFGFTIARLRDRDGVPFMLTRSGFTGELGYEIFCDQADALEIWDALVEEGEAFGLKIMGGDALGMLRIEAGLMVAGAEFGPDADALESGLGFAVDFKKEHFIGRAALERNAKAVRKKLVGLMFNANEAPSHGDGVFVGREQVGVITSATASPELGRAIAMARVAVENAEIGTVLEVGCLDGHMKRLPCNVCALPFIDPQRTKARA